VVMSSEKPEGSAPGGLAKATAAIAPVASLVAMPGVAAAETVNPTVSALFAYGHFASLSIILACLAIERLTLEEITEDVEEGSTELITPKKSLIERLVIADSLYGISGLVLLYTGVQRVSHYAKGWEYYQHEPIFWVKMLLFGVAGSSSLLPTIKIIQMAAKMNETGEAPEVAPQLIARLKKVVNGELLAFLAIPLTASLMARGVGYNADIPWQAMAGGVAVPTLGLTAKYVAEALTFDKKLEEAST